MDTTPVAQIIDSGSAIDWSAWVTAGATIVLAGLTFMYVRLTKKILESQSAPLVVVSVVHDEDRSTVLQLVIRNVGQSVATDVRFTFSRPLPAKAFGIETAGAKEAEPMKDGPLINGIPALAPGDTRRLDWGQYGGLLKNLGEQPVSVFCHFKHGTRSMPPIECKLDIKSFEGTSAVSSPRSKIARDLEKIASDLHHVTTGFKKLHVNVAALPKPEEGEDRDV